MSDAKASPAEVEALRSTMLLKLQKAAEAGKLSPEQYSQFVQLKQQQQQREQQDMIRIEKEKSLSASTSPLARQSDEAPAFRQNSSPTPAAPRAPADPAALQEDLTADKSELIKMVLALKQVMTLLHKTKPDQTDPN